MTNIEVVRAWSRSKTAKSGRLKTDGKDLYSYGLRIGRTDNSGNKIALNFTAKTGNFYSMTTSKHVGLAKRYADRISLS